MTWQPIETLKYEQEGTFLVCHRNSREVFAVVWSERYGGLLTYVVPQGIITHGYVSVKHLSDWQPLPSAPEKRDD